VAILGLRIAQPVLPKTFSLGAALWLYLGVEVVQRMHPLDAEASIDNKGIANSEIVGC